MTVENTPAAPVVAPAEDDFAAAFAQLTAGEPGVAAAPDEPAEPAVPAASVVADAPAEPAVPAAPVVADAPAEPAAPAADAPADDPMARITALQAELAALKAAPAVAPAAPATPAAPAALYTADEQTVLTQYAKDWPEVAQAEALVRRGEYRDLVAHVFAEVQKRYDHMLDYVETRSSKDQYSEIKTAVPDYDVVRDKTIAWVETQPAYLKAAYTQVVEGGTAADVADLIARFKKETNYAAPTAAAPAAAPAVGMAAAPAPAVKPAAAAAAAKLKPVSSQRGEQSAGADPNDFEGAFAEFAREGR